MDLLETVKNAERNKKAVAHFNVANLEMLKAISHVAEKFGVPIIVGVSEGERAYMGVHHIADLIRSYNEEHHTKQGYHLFLNADHTHSLENVEKAVRAGFDALVFDAADKSFEENIERTAEAVQRAHSIRQNIIVEGELGYLGQSSRLLATLPEGSTVMLEDLPTVEQIREFVERTGVNMVAPAVGNVHGMFRSTQNPEIQIERIQEIKSVVEAPLILHGGSGITDEAFILAIDAGMSVVHISTELRRAWRTAWEQAMQDNPDEIASYKMIPSVLSAMEEVIERRVKLFWKI